MYYVINAAQIYITLQFSQMNTLVIYSGIIHQDLLHEK